MKKLLILLLLCLSKDTFSNDKIGPWDLNKLYKTPKWEKTDKAAKDGIQGLLYSSIAYLEKEVQVFAYYSSPKGKAPAGGWPAVVCIHGGGGTAFDKWVKTWNDNGFAAISMDLEGHYPIGSHKKGRESTPKPGPSRVGVFHDFEKPVEEQWYFHAVSQIILAHSLIRSFPEINKDKIGVTGISWGGNLTSTVMGVDNRFKFAIPAYGCGFLPGSDGNQGRAIKKGKHWDTVAKYYDGSAYFANVKIPTLWVNGTNDFHFPMPSTQKSSQAVNNESTLRFQVRMKHGHGPVWVTKECYAFAKSIVSDGPALLKVAKPLIKNDELSVKVTGSISEAVLVYTSEGGKIWPDREWKEIKASINGSLISAKIPKEAITAFINVKDSLGLMISSEYVEVNK